MGWLIVIILCALYLLIFAGVHLYVWWRVARDGERPRWLVEESQVLACTPEDAFAFVGDPRNDVRLSPRVVAVTLDAPGGPHAGATYRETLRFGPGTRTFAGAITEYDPPRAIGLRFEIGRRPFFSGYRVAPHPGGCVVTSIVGSTQTAAGIMTGNLGRWLMRRECRKNLARIRAILEAPVAFP